MIPSLKKFEEVADKCFGNVTHIANAFKVTRKTVYEWMTNPEYDAAVELGRDKILDVAENAAVVLMQGIPILDDSGKRVGWQVPPNASCANYILGSRGAKRGYGQKIEADINLKGKVRSLTPKEASDYIRQIEESC